MCWLEEEPLHNHTLGEDLESYVEGNNMGNHELFLRQEENVIDENNKVWNYKDYGYSVPNICKLSHSIKLKSLVLEKQTTWTVAHQAPLSIELSRQEYWSGEPFPGIGEFNSDGHYIYYCGQESLRRNGVALTVNKSLKCWLLDQSQNLDAISKTTEWSLFISKVNHAVSELSKSVPQPVMPKNLKLNSSVKTYKTF